MNSLLQAVMNQEDVSIVRTFLDSKADVNATDSKGVSALHYASQVGNLDLIQQQVDNSADVHSKDHRDMTAQHRARHVSSRVKVVRCLLDSNVDVNAKDISGQTALHLHFRDIDTARYLLANQADVNSVDCYDQTVLHLAAQQMDVSIISLLAENQADMNAVDRDDKTPLIYAADLSYLRVLQSLLDNKADIDAVDSYGATVLHRVLSTYGDQSGAVKVAACLIQNNANLRLVDNDGRSVISLALEHGFLTIIPQILEHEVDLNTTDKLGNTVQHNSICWQLPDLVAQLLAKGADVEMRNKEEKTTLHLAVEEFYDAEILECLLTSMNTSKTTLPK